MISCPPDSIIAHSGSAGLCHFCSNLRSAINEFYWIALVAEYRHRNGKCNLQHYPNNCGAEFLEKKRLHEKEAKDLRRWTELALSPGEEMHIIGF